MKSFNGIIKKVKGIKKIYLIGAAIVLLAGVGFGVWKSISGSNNNNIEAEGETQIQTTTVMRGSLRDYVEGAGSLIAEEELDLNFTSNGILGELYVAAGDEVKAGDELAKLESTESLELAVATKELAYVQAKQALQEFQDSANVNMADAYSAMITAKSTYEDASTEYQSLSYARCSEEVNKKYTAQVERYQGQLDELNERYYGSDQWISVKDQLDTALANLNYCTEYSETEVLEAEGNMNVAETEYLLAQATYDELVADEGIDKDELELLQAQLEQAEKQLAVAQEDLEGATIVAPMDGTIMAISASVGEMVKSSGSGAEALITLSNVDTLYLDIFMDTTNSAYMEVGNKIEAVLDAFPDDVYYGEIIQVDPEIYSSGMFGVLHGVASIEFTEEDSEKYIPLGLTASINVIKAETQNALLLNVAALKDLGDGEYAVFVMDQQTGELKMVSVEVGVISETYAEIISGLSQGDIVSTGVVSAGE